VTGTRIRLADLWPRGEGAPPVYDQSAWISRVFDAEGAPYERGLIPGEMVDSSSLLLYLYLALVFCHAAGAGGGGLEPGLLGTSAAGGRITSLRVRANDGMRKRQDGIMPLRGGADFRTYKKSKYDSSDEDEEEKLPPQLEHDVPWKIDTVDKDDVKDGGKLIRSLGMHHGHHHCSGLMPVHCHHSGTALILLFLSSNLPLS
jgi:hypothetical protein